MAFRQSVVFKLSDSDWLPTWSQQCPGTGDYFQIKILDSKRFCIRVCTNTAATVFAIPRSATLYTQQNGWNTAESFQIIWLLIVCTQISSILRLKRWTFSSFLFETIELRHVCSNHAFQSSLLFHLTIFLSTAEFVFQDWAPFASSLVTCILLVAVLA